MNSGRSNGQSSVMTRQIGNRPVKNLFNLFFNFVFIFTRPMFTSELRFLLQAL